MLTLHQCAALTMHHYAVLCIKVLTLQQYAVLTH